MDDLSREPSVSPTPATPRLRLHAAPRQSLTIHFDPQSKTIDMAAPPLPSIARGDDDFDSALQPMEPTDPRWVLAVRTSQVMQGDIVRPADREQLIRTGAMMGLNAFESNLVIAIVQDQARRGLNVDAAAKALRFVPIGREDRAAAKRRWMMRVAMWCVLAAAVELLIIFAVV